MRTNYRVGLIKKLEQMEKRMRLRALKMALDAGSNGAHLDSAMSCMEIFAVLYGSVLRFDVSNPAWIASKLPIQSSI